MKQFNSPGFHLPKRLSIFFFIGLASLCACKEEDLPADRRHIYEDGSYCDRTFVDTQLIEEELNQLTYPLEGASPNLSSEALTAIGTAVGDTPLVGLGEATHGTKEFFEMKDRIFRYLVESHGFKAMGFEATWGGALYVNDYIVNGNGNSRDAISKMQFWTWDTEEVQALVEWMHDYNQTQPEDDKIYFYGFDMQSGSEEAYWIEQFLQTHAPDLTAPIMANISEFLANTGNYQNLSATQRDTYRANLIASQTQFEANSELLIAQSSQSEFDLILKAFDVLLQFEDYSRPDATRSRDEYMAENSEWIRDYIGGDAKVALWAHNGHVTTAGTFESQGEFLNASHGDDYKNIGFSFSMGKFQALNGIRQLTIENEVSEVRCNSVNELFSALTAANFYLVMDDLESTTHAQAYFNESRDFLSIGALYDESAPNSYYFRTNLVESYDVVIHFEVSTSAVPLP